MIKKIYAKVVSFIARDALRRECNKGCERARSLLNKAVAEPQWSDIGLGHVAADGSTVYAYVGRARAGASLVWGPYPSAAIDIEQGRRLALKEDRNTVALGGTCTRRK